MILPREHRAEDGRFVSGEQAKARLNWTDAKPAGKFAGVNWIRNTLATVLLSALATGVTAETKPVDAGATAVEREFRELLKLDDRVHDEVDKWIRDNSALAEVDAGITRDSLSAQVRIRLQKVENAYVAFVAKHPKHLEARLAFGSYYSGLGEADKAIGQWIEARQIDRNNPVPWNNLGKAYGQKGNVSESIRHFTKATEIAPNQSLYYRNLAAMLFAYPDHAARHYLIDRNLIVPKVISLFKKARELDPKNFPLAADAAMAYLATKPLQSKEAITAWNEALALAPDDRSKQGVRIHLARIHAHIGGSKTARDILSKVNDPKLAGLKEEILKKLDAPTAPAKP